MRVGVLGGGLLGCCTALALADRGLEVVLFDRNQDLLSRAAIANEGKIHLGYMYAADPSLLTARAMMEGALTFAPFLQRFVETSSDAFKTSVPAAYVVHRDSQHSAEAVTAYLTGVHQLIVDAMRGRELAYFGMDLSAPPRAWSASQRDAVFNPKMAVAAFDTPEVAINPEALAVALRDCIAAHPKIELRLERLVVRADNDTDAIYVTSDAADGRVRDAFDHVVNALWDGRLAIDATMGLKPGRPWLHRLKYGVSFKIPAGVKCPPSATVVLGPFGEVVSYPDRRTYLTWYPECLHGISSEVSPPDWDTYAPEPLSSRILQGTLAGVSSIIPSLADFVPRP